MLKGKAILIFCLPFYSVQIHINKMISFRKSKSQPTCYFSLVFKPTDCISNVQNKLIACVGSLNMAGTESSIAAKLWRWWGGSPGLTPGRRRGPSGAVVPQGG